MGGLDECGYMIAEGVGIMGEGPVPHQAVINRGGPSPSTAAVNTPVA